MISLKSYVLVLCFASIFSNTFAADAKLLQQRKLFQQAQKSLHNNQIKQYRNISQQLTAYPLRPYLEYLYLRHRLDHLPEKQIREFLFSYPDTFFAERLRNRWLDKLAEKKQWQRFLTYYQAPQPASRQCLRLQALIATGQQQAFSEIHTLWLVPKSQDKKCDPVFKAWQQQGLLTDDLRRQRIYLALQENQFSLAKYIAKTLPDAKQQTAWINHWQQVHQQPLALLNQLPVQNKPALNKISLAHDIDISRNIIKHGIERLARKSTEKASSSWQRIQNEYQFNEQDKLQIQRIIANQAALNKEDSALGLFGDLPAEPWRVRAALWQQNWLAVQNSILSLNIDEQKTPRWQYWLGRSLAELGQTEQANATFRALVQERDYYSFLAADKLKLPYQMNHHPITFDQSKLNSFSKQPAIQRLKEFYALNMLLEARRQVYQLEKTLTPYELQLLATLTHQWGWHNQTIAILGKARYWDALNLRFPILYDNEILKASKKTGIDPSWLLGIARQESAFNPKASSHAGAMGLMQIMPNTGKLIARIVNKPLKKTSELLNPQRNIQLGSAYLKRMLDKNQHNPVLATASYNAGPYRVKNWMPKHDLPADIWIENIPFNETRHYTSNVLAYAAVFDYQRKQTITPLSNRMPVVIAKTP